MIGLRIELNWAQFLGTIERHVIGGLRPEFWPALFPHTIARVAGLAEEGVRIWQAKALALPGQEGRPLRLTPYVRLSQTEYARSILSEPVGGDPQRMRYEVGSTSDQAELIDDGTPSDQHPMDLHAVLGSAPKARVSKAGKKYLRIPFRHAATAPGGISGQRFQAAGQRVLTPNVVRAMQKKRQYLITSSYTEPSIHKGGPLVQRFRYTKPDPLTAADIKALNDRSRKHPISDDDAKRLKGLLRAGTKGHSRYLTIRTLSEANLTGWRIPEYKPQHVVSKVVDELNQLVESGQYFDEAMQADADHIVSMMGAA